MTHLEIVNKLIGPIRPVGETNTDAERFENLKALCELADGILEQIHSVATDFKDRPEFSMARSGKSAKAFLENMGINQ
jgi:hypothetical protein